jgi:hypothetical protein
MVATQQVKEKNIIIYESSKQTNVYVAESTLHVRFINFSHLVTM